MRVVLRAVIHLFERVLHSLSLLYRILLFLRKLCFVCTSQAGHYCLVYTLPVVDILSLSPLAFKSLLTLLHRHGTIEIPCGILSSALWCCCIWASSSIGITVSAVPLQGLLRISLSLAVAFFLFFLLECRYYSVNSLITLLLVHFCKSLQGVLQIDGVSERHQLVENLRASGQLLIVVTFLVKQSDSLAIASACICEFFLLPIDVAQLEQEHTFLYAGTGGLHGSFLVIGYSVGSITLSHINVSYSIVYLVKIVLVLVRCSHALQRANHFLCLSCAHHLRHRYSCIKLHLIGRVLGYYAPESLICRGVIAQSGIDLPEQEAQACSLHLSHLVFYGLLQVWHGLVVLSCVYVVVGHGEVPFLLRPPMYGVTIHVSYYILSIV